MKEVLIVGGGAAGMLSAIMAARKGHKVFLFEQNEKLGKKLFITGKGRCNVTNACDVEELLKNIVSNSKFLYSAFYTFASYDMISFLEDLGLTTKIERGNRVFPASDKSSDVIAVMQKEIKRLGVEVFLNSRVIDIHVDNQKFKYLVLSNGEKFNGDAVIIATGGLSYQTTGATGDGYKFAGQMGHTITPTSPSLVPFNIKESWSKELQGLSLKNIKFTMKSGTKTIFEDFGELIFTHFGISGPLVLSASAYYAGTNLSCQIDLKPALDLEQLDARLIRDFKKYHNKQFRNGLGDLLPTKLIPVIVRLSEIDSFKKISEVTREERLRLCRLMKNLTMTVSGLRNYNEAIITKGGIAVNEVNPSTMESKIIKNIYFIGEVLDIDALTGGFNLQIAWSTAYTAGISIS